MIYIDQETLRKIQIVQLEMLIEMDRICKKHEYAAELCLI